MIFIIGLNYRTFVNLELLKPNLVLTRERLSELQQQASLFREYIHKEVPMPENLLLFYRKSHGVTKKRILSTIFAEKLFLEKGKVATPVFT